MSYQVTARKWRPMVFEEIVGQSHVTETLRNAIKTQRVAHAYLFSGPRGCGKTTAARILAKVLNCSSPANFNPDNTCDSCSEINTGRSLDVIEIDGASNRGVEEIRNLREAVRYTPTRGKYKIYIIDEVHMLTKEAFNALLKTLEEPPSHIIFIFATTEVHRVPLTIISRCQRFDFRRISVAEIVARLKLIAEKEHVEIDDQTLTIIAKKGDGSLRDSQSIFDQVVAFCGTKITAADVLKALNIVDEEIFFRVTDLIRTRETKSALALVEELSQRGYEWREFVAGLAEHFRNLLVILTTGSAELIETSEPYKKRYQTEAQSFSENDLLRLVKMTHDLEQAIRWSPEPRYKLEISLLQMVKMESAVRIEDLLQQLEELKKKLDRARAETSISQPNRSVGSASSGSEMKVVGTVSAGRLKSAAAVAVQPQAPARSTPPSSYHQMSSGSGVQQDVVVPVLQPFTSSPTMQPISARDAYAQWQKWVDEVRRTKISVGTVLSETEILDVRNGSLRIACPDDYHYSTLKRSKEFLVDAFAKVTGVKVHIEPVVDRKSVVKPLGSSAMHYANEAGGANNENGEDHPVIAALKRELGAEPVE
jgi:DNA polymerase-3 subunit gamma/tau